MSEYIFRPDARHFFPGQWDKMTPEERENLQSRLAAIQTRRRGNTGVTPGKQNFLQSIPAPEMAGIATPKQPI